MKVNAKSLAAVLFLGMIVITSTGFAAQKRCKAEGKAVECPTRTAAEIEKAAANYEQEAMDMAAGKGGSTYGIKPFDYLTGVGKMEDTTKNAKKANTKDFSTESGYSKGTGKTEVWARKKASKGKSNAEKYNQWTNNWSPSFKETLVPGTNPNEGKQWYYVYCIGCHGWTLKGDGPNAIYLDPFPRDLTAGNVYMNKKTNLELFQVIKGGGSAVGLSDAMPAWGNLLMDQDIWNTIAWIRANADRQKIKHGADLENYLNPKSSFDPNSKANAVNALNAKDNADYQDIQDELESGMAGRGGALEGAGFVEGGLRGDALKTKK